MRNMASEQRTEAGTDGSDEAATGSARYSGRVWRYPRRFLS